MKKTLKFLINKNYSIYVDGKFERRATFFDLMDLLITTTDFLDFTPKEKLSFLQYGIKRGGFEFEDDVSIRFKGELSRKT